MIYLIIIKLSISIDLMKVEHGYRNIKIDDDIYWTRVYENDYKPLAV